MVELLDRYKSGRGPAAEEIKNLLRIGKVKSTLLAGALIVGMFAPMVIAGPADAVGGFRVAWTTSYGLNVRSGPGSGHAALGRLADGTGVDLNCWVRGELVNGRNNVWYKLNSPVGGGFVTASYVTTPTDPLPGLPACGANPQPVPLQAGSNPVLQSGAVCIQGGCPGPVSAPPVQAPQTPANKAVEWARNQVGKTHADEDVARLYASNWAPGPRGEWSGDCLLFVNHAYKVAGVNTTKAENAYQAFLAYQRQGRIRKDGTPPLGALVFLRMAMPAGHVVISTGDGSAIGTQGVDHQRRSVVHAPIPTQSLLGWVLP